MPTQGNRRVGYFPVDNGFESSSQFYRADSISLCCGSEKFNDVHVLVRKDKIFACTTNVLFAGLQKNSHKEMQLELFSSQYRFYMPRRDNDSRFFLSPYMPA